MEVRTLNGHLMTFKKISELRSKSDLRKQRYNSLKSCLVTVRVTAFGTPFQSSHLASVEIIGMYHPSLV